MSLVGALLDGKYRILRLIGEGGMGAVYEAEHQLIGRHVAVKMLHPEYARYPDAVQRFHREARAASQIGHVNIIDVTDMGVDEDGRPYLVMELLHGTALAAVLRDQQVLPVARAADIVGQCLAALGAAHDKGIIHRDFKPDNVFLIDPGGRPDFVKLLDFGISKIRALQGDPQLTRTGAVLGTPFYMSPEQAMGRPGIDHRSDLYAVGAVLYEMLAGCRPFDGTSYNEVLAKVITEAPRPLRSLRPDVDPRLESVVAAAMSRDVAVRPSSAAEMLEALLPFGAARTPYSIQPQDGRAPAAITGGGRAAAATPTPAAALVFLETAPSANPADAGRWGPAESPAAADAGPELDEPPRPPRRRLPQVVVAALALAGIVTAIVLLVGRGRRGPEAGPASDRASATVASVGATADASGAPPLAHRAVFRSTPHAPPSPVSAAAGEASSDGASADAAGSASAACPPGMILVPAGPFVMGFYPPEGRSIERPAHVVTLSAYCIDATEVTNAQWRACAESGACAPPTCGYGPGDHPVVCVDWDQASRYCVSLGRRLPTEAEWEKAARGGCVSTDPASCGRSDARAYPWGNDAPTCERTNKEGCLGGTGRVASHPSGDSPYGVHDMAGNVWEWVADWYAGDTYGSCGDSCADPAGPAEGRNRVLRGGGWSAEAVGLLVATRSWADPEVTHNYVGLRCAKSP